MQPEAYKEEVSALSTELASSPSTHQCGARRSSTLLRRIIGGLLLLSLYVMSQHSPSVTNHGLSEHTESIFLPFIYKFGTNGVPQVWCTVAGVTLRMPIDTGSTCLLVGAPILSHIGPTAGIPAHHFFSSSRILYVGRLVELPLEFPGEAGMYATATVPVLIVDKSWRCPWYNPKKDGFNCPLGPDGEKALERSVSHITYMGVGFGRNHPSDGMPFGAPGINPFLNVDSIGGSPTSEQNMRSGYVISTEGIYLGLTEENTRAFAFEDLQPGWGHADDPRDWAMAKMCFDIDNDGPNCGPLLVDTGIAQMYIRAQEGVSIPTVVIKNPNKHGYAKTVKRVKSGTEIFLRFPLLEPQVGPYSFVVGENSTTDPSYVVPAKNASSPFINTGRNFLFSYSIAFDAIAGRFGLRPESHLSSSSLL